MNNIAALIDHTLLDPQATLRQIEKHCWEAVRYKFHSVCVQPSYVRAAHKILRNTPVEITSVVGFPLGANDIATKVFESLRLQECGAREIDFVVHLGAVKSKNWQYVEHEIREITKLRGPLYKVIIECGLLVRSEKLHLCRIIKNSGAHFVKTSTGFGFSGATIADVKLLRKNVGRRVHVKAAGGIRDARSAISMLRAGADRIGTSCGVQILKQLK
jgi:deoxyribose-phosphate aldolase